MESREVLALKRVGGIKRNTQQQISLTTPEQTGTHIIETHHNWSHVQYMHNLSIVFSKLWSCMYNKPFFYWQVVGFVTFIWCVIPIWELINNMNFVLMWRTRLQMYRQRIQRILEKTLLYHLPLPNHLRDLKRKQNIHYYLKVSCT